MAEGIVEFDELYENRVSILEDGGSVNYIALVSGIIFTKDYGGGPAVRGVARLVKYGDESEVIYDVYSDLSEPAVFIGIGVTVNIGFDLGYKAQLQRNVWSEGHDISGETLDEIFRPIDEAIMEVYQRKISD
tara:strand:+ start:734 stop:1129 length:396 start_codon:yes stop_codon:yes gene_type:complete